jgi:hypothetical protein
LEIKNFKGRIKAWARHNQKEKLRKLEILEEDINRRYLGMSRDGLDSIMESHLKLLEAEHNEILKFEEYWRQKSRATWLKCEDCNTKFFHKFASARRSHKHIWEIGDEIGQIFRGQEEIKGEATRYFKKLYVVDDSQAPVDQANLARIFNRFVTADDNVVIDRVVTKQEIWDILSNFAKDKSPGPDGWTTEFFTLFFDVVGDDLLDMVEDSRTRGKIQKSLNSTFLTLIPKENSSRTFGDYIPISLCNLCYKLISKVIANRIKPILSRELSVKQLGFLKGR